ncbi:hypothetical protein [Streptomyces acidicola]|uniref:hypothetical protein n=1 Tax=Streptomyces acidicola TaxID=2596892 RepID=UPI003828FCA9
MDPDVCERATKAPVPADLARRPSGFFRVTVAENRATDAAASGGVSCEPPEQVTPFVNLNVADLAVEAHELVSPRVILPPEPKVTRES